MARHRLGQPDEARRALRGAREALDRWTAAAFESPGRFVPVQPWWDWVELRVLYREAHRLVEGADPPEDARLHVVRGRAFAALGRADRADAEFARALRLAPDDPKIREACAARPKGRD
jgi:Flp pilus assembly protein TadD